MREAISNAMVFNLVIIFVIILLAFFIGSLSYSKASKVKNRIVEVIEKEGEFNDDAIAEIDTWLGEIGYRANTAAGRVSNCPNIDVRGATVRTATRTNSYEYCVYEIHQCDNPQSENRCDTYYRVVSYMYFDVPIIAELVRIPVTGETMSFTELNS